MRSYLTALDIFLALISLLMIISNFVSDDQIRSQSCTCHGSSVVMACAGLQPDVVNILKNVNLVVVYKQIYETRIL